MTDFEKKRREKRARQIAQEIDPQSGGFFRNCMTRAALLGMEFVSPLDGESVADTPVPDRLSEQQND